MSRPRTRTLASQGVVDKPYMAVLSDGRILFTVPGNGTLMLFDADCAPNRQVAPGWGAKPLGVAAMAGGGLVFRDAGHDPVQIVPGAEIAELFR